MDALSEIKGDAKVGRALARRRAEAGLTTEQLARRSSLSLPRVRAIEEGRTVIYLDDLVQLAQALGKSPSTLFSELHRDASADVDHR